MAAFSVNCKSSNNYGCRIGRVQVTVRVANSVDIGETIPAGQTVQFCDGEPFVALMNTVCP